MQTPCSAWQGLPVAGLAAGSRGSGRVLAGWAGTTDSAWRGLFLFCSFQRRRAGPAKLLNTTWRSPLCIRQLEWNFPPVIVQLHFRGWKDRQVILFPPSFCCVGICIKGNLLKTVEWLLQLAVCIYNSRSHIVFSEQCMCQGRFYIKSELSCVGGGSHMSSIITLWVTHVHCRCVYERNIMSCHVFGTVFSKHAWFFIVCKSLCSVW